MGNFMGEKRNQDTALSYLISISSQFQSLLSIFSKLDCTSTRWERQSNPTGGHTDTILMVLCSSNNRKIFSFAYKIQKIGLFQFWSLLWKEFQDLCCNCSLTVIKLQTGEFQRLESSQSQSNYQSCRQPELGLLPGTSQSRLYIYGYCTTGSLPNKISKLSIKFPKTFIVSFRSILKVSARSLFNDN